MLLIAFGNKSRQGKDTAAEAIREHYERKNRFFTKPVKVCILKFADALYQETNDYLEIGYNLGYTTAELFKKGVREVVGGEIVQTNIPDWVKPDPSPTFPKNAPFGKHPLLLQWWGTELRRAQDPDYWVKKTFDNIPKNADIVLISDLRFPNEAKAIVEHDGFTINVQRLNSDSTPYISTDRDSNHYSEIALDNYNFDYYIKSKTPVVTAELAVTYAELLKGIHD